MPITELWLRDDVVIQDSSTWRSLLTALPSVSKIILGKASDFRRFLLALTPFFAPEDDSSDDKDRLPSLQEVELLGMDEFSWDEYLDVMQYLLKQRKASGSPLRLSLLMCTQLYHDGDRMKDALRGEYPTEISLFEELAAEVNYVPIDAWPRYKWQGEWEDGWEQCGKRW